MLVFFFPFFENLGSYVYDSMRGRVRLIVFERHISAAIFSLRSCTACARVLSLCMLAPAHAGSPATTAPALSATRRQRRKVDKCRVADKKQTNQQTNRQTHRQTNKQTNTHYSFIGIDYIPVLADHAEPCSATVPSQHWAAEKQT